MTCFYLTSDCLFSNRRLLFVMERLWSGSFGASLLSILERFSVQCLCNGDNERDSKKDFS